MNAIPQDLSKVPLLALVREIEGRTFASLVVCKLKESSPEADIRIHMHADPKHELDLLGISSMAHGDVLAGVTRQLMGPPDHQEIV